jgi:hypothetical protein
MHFLFNIEFSKNLGEFFKKTLFMTCNFNFSFDVLNKHLNI